MGEAQHMPVDTRRSRPPKLSDVTGGAQRRQVVVTSALAGERLDKALAALSEDVSRTLARKAIANGGVFLGLDRCKVASRKVSPDDCLTITWHPAGHAGRTYPLHIIHEDSTLVVVHKPAGQHVQGTAQGDAGTLVVSLQKRFGAATQLAHRLDAPASGLVIAGRDSGTVAELMTCFREHTVTRAYLAVVLGVPRAGECRLPLARDGRRMRIAARDEPEAKPAHTDVEVLWQGEGKALVRAQLHTGRMHQVRAHLSGLGAPIVGDRLYGAERAPRLCLHAVDLGVSLPGRDKLTLHTPPPEDFWMTAELPEEARKAIEEPPRG
ncbi:MAG: RluA family pseudouridine synthase [Myxococcota bacterium]